MNNRAQVLLFIAFVGGILVWLARLLPMHETVRSSWWSLALLGTAIGTLTLLKSYRTPLTHALGAWALVVPIAALEGESDHGLMTILSVTAFLVGAASLLGVRMFVPEIIVTDQDVDRLSRLLDVLPPAQRAAATPLEAELARAHVVSPHAVPRDVVTMNSRVLFEDEDTGKRAEVVLGYPHSASEGTISVLAPVGTALLGLRAGQCIDWRMPTGRCKRLRVVDVTYQPEAAGDFHL